MATVVIGGLITATILTIIVIPSIYYIINSGKMKGIKLGALPLFASLCFSSMAVAQDSIPELSSIEQAVSWAKEHHPDLSEAAYRIEQAEKIA